MTILNEIEHDKTNNDKTHFNNTTPTKFIEILQQANINQSLLKYANLQHLRLKRNVSFQRTHHSLLRPA